LGWRVFAFARRRRPWRKSVTVMDPVLGTELATAESK
jgi:hypothetical protein